MKFFITFLLSICLSIIVVYQIKGQAQDNTIYSSTFPEPEFEHLTIADGLPENSVSCILQDHLGYMWFGTQNGLVRYDGYSMKIFQPDSNDSLSISERHIQTIYEDKSGTIWIGTQYWAKFF